MKHLMLISVLLTTLVVFAVGNLVLATPNGPGKALMEVCHWCELHHRYVQLYLGPSGADMHYDNHIKDCLGPCPCPD